MNLLAVTLAEAQRAADAFRDAVARATGDERRFMQARATHDAQLWGQIALIVGGPSAIRAHATLSHGVIIWTFADDAPAWPERTDEWDRIDKRLSAIARKACERAEETGREADDTLARQLVALRDHLRRHAATAASEAARIAARPPEGAHRAAAAH